MITLPRFQQSICGLNLKTGTLIILYAELIIFFVNLIMVTIFRSENENVTKGETNLYNILNMMVTILTILITPFAIYGVYQSRPNFLIPYIINSAVGIILLIFNFAINLIQTRGFFDNSFREVILLLILILFVNYSFLIVFSHYSVLKEEREEIK